MTTENLGLFQAIGAKMGYLDHRQKVLAQNVANADTPGYRPRDLTEVDFGTVMERSLDNRWAVRPATTQAGHMPEPNKVEDADNREQRITYDVAPAGNAVILEEQMVKTAETTMDYNLMTTLYQKNLGLIRTALGSQ